MVKLRDDCNLATEVRVMEIKRFKLCLRKVKAIGLNNKLDGGNKWGIQKEGKGKKYIKVSGFFLSNCLVPGMICSPEKN